MSPDTPETTVSPLTRRRLLRIGASATAAGLCLPSLSNSAAGASTTSPVWETTSAGTVQATCPTEHAVYVATDTGRVRALGISNGTAVVETDLVRPIITDCLAVGGKDLVAVTANNRLHVLARETLASRWKKPIAAGCMGVVTHGSLLTYTAATDNSEEGELITLDRTTGEPRWRQSLDVYSRPFVVGDYIGVFGDWNSDGESSWLEDSFILFDRESGEVQWSTPVEFTTGWAEVFPSVVRAGDRLLLTSLKGDHSGVVALDFTSGTRLWETTFDETDPHGEVVTDGSIAAIRSGNKLRALSTTSGEIRWTSELTVSRGGLALADGTLFAAGEGSTGHALLALNPTSGVIKWERPTGLGYERVVAAGGRLYAVEHESGTVVAISQTESGPTLAGTKGDRKNGAESDGRASFNLSGTNLRVPVGDTGTITLSAINLLDSKPMSVQLILGTPSGVSVVGVDGADEGSNQYTATTTIPAGSETNIDVHLQVNEPGEFPISGRYVYTFGDSNVSLTREQVVKIVGETTEEASAGENTSSGDGPGFGIVGGILGILGAGAVRLRRRD